jgi:hypothetical protein
VKRVAAGVSFFVAFGAAAMPLLPRDAAALVCSAPSVSGVSVTPPGSGQALQQQHGPAGSVVTLTGSGFSQVGCSTTVAINGALQSATIVNNSTLNFTANGGPSGPLAVMVSDGGTPVSDNSHLNYVTDPAASGLDTASPTTGATLHMLGSGFQLNVPGTSVSASYQWGSPPNGNPCPGASGSATVTDPQHITLTAPSQYCDGTVTVKFVVPADAGNSRAPMVWNFAQGFDIAAHVSGMSRQSAVPGQTVTVNGSGFGAQGGNATVNGVAATVQSWADTAVNVMVPSGATSGTFNLARAVDGAQFSPGSLGVNASVSGVSPSQAAVGDTVTVSGAGFGSQTGGVNLGGTAANVQQWSPSTIVFTVPDGLGPGGTSIGITTSGTNAPGAPPFTVLPRITGVTPGHAAAGSLIEIDGTSFGTQQGGVQVGGQDGSVTLWGDKSVLVSLPAGLSPGSTTIALTPPASSAATYAYSIDAPPPPSASNGGSGSSSGSGSGSSSGGSNGGGGHSSVPGTPGVSVSSDGLILPSASGPVIAHGPVQFVKPSPPPGPVSLKLDTKANQSDPGTDVPFTVTLIAFGKPVVGAPVDLLLVIEPGSDAALNPSHAVTDADGRVSGTIHLSKTAGDHIVLARSGIYSDEVRLVGRGATNAVASGHVGGAADGGAPSPSLVSVRSPVLWALIACVLLFGAGFGLNLMTSPTVAGGASAPAADGRGRDARESLREMASAAGSLARFGAGVVAVVGSLALGALRGR